MEIYHSLKEYSAGGCAAGVALGKFDGIHIGHARLIRDMVRLSHERGMKAVVFAIEINDYTILSHDERSCYLEALGADILIECPFSREFMDMLPEEFVKNVLHDALHAGYVFVGPDFCFGRGRSGSADLLRSLGEAWGYETCVIEKEEFGGEVVSSTRVRRELFNGNMELVRDLLGREYPVRGTVTHGRHLGTGIGFPTINIYPDSSKLLPPPGVYASFTCIDSRIPEQNNDSDTDAADEGFLKRIFGMSVQGIVRPGMTNLGTRPTVDGKSFRAETNLFDFDSDVYGCDAVVVLICYIRPVIKFGSLDELKQQLLKDKETAIEVLRGRG